MISPWTVYWVMQLDPIGNFFSIFGWFAIIISTICLIIRAVAAADAADGDTSAKTVKEALDWARGGFAVALLSLFICTMLPSSKTAAAMILVPALTSQEVMEPVGKEAKELYTLAKSALANLADKQPAPPAANEATKGSGE